MRGIDYIRTKTAIIKLIVYWNSRGGNKPLAAVDWLAVWLNFLTAELSQNTFRR